MGAVSKTMRSYFPDSMWLIAEAKAVASSIPGMLENCERVIKESRIANRSFLYSVLGGW